MDASELKRIRKKLSFSQKKFAELCDVGIRTVQFWESGERIIPKGAISIINEYIKNSNTPLLPSLSIEEMSIYIHDHLPAFENNKTFNMVVDGIIKNRLIKELEKKERIIEELENKNKKLKR